MFRLSGKAAAAMCLAVATACAVTACSDNGSHPVAAPNSVPAVSNSSPSSGETGVSNGAAQVVITNFAFSPTTLTVTPGETVTVLNKDSTAHTLTATGKAFDTGDITPGKSGSFIAPTIPGTYSYICMIHQFMHGTLTVK
ncbi:blue (type 1) copper domain protein [Catenulispora acidiphila DSM 44928]|uniref:Blue (Type 1) copper domain protein n=1 Tax=Catenulispora acidiphila (strain DSM 44928 / JCM 14897 / NBRC 102108 / NRRL B-24433 / ID139908) TaxID=479433 RepID=C7QEU0_CATAD|nr:cupredoxin domain-containing protein [Catenulispora acidiphila]ACU72860.1 blue (type 1) copper domain protein [Catenulispora acidiphila DSM 44928]